MQLSRLARSRASRVDRVRRCSAWHVRHAPSVTARLRGVMRIGSWNVPVVKSNECQKPLRALVTYLPTRSWRRVAVVADRDGAVARALPAVELLAHDVAVRARLRIVAQVRRAARVDEGVATQTQQQAQHDADRDRISRLHAGIIAM